MVNLLLCWYIRMYAHSTFIMYVNLMQCIIHLHGEWMENIYKELCVYTTYVIYPTPSCHCQYTRVYSLGELKMRYGTLSSIVRKTYFWEFAIDNKRHNSIPDLSFLYVKFHCDTFCDSRIERLEFLDEGDLLI